MRRLLRQFRRPVVILAGLYLASIGFFAGALPYQPAMIVPHGASTEMVIGFSPDGHRFATGPDVIHVQHWLNRDGKPVMFWPDDPFQIWRLDTANATRAELRPGVDIRGLAWFVGSPAGRHLFWRYLDDQAWWGRRPLTNPVYGAAPSPDGRWAARSDGAIVTEWESGKTVLNDTASPVACEFLSGRYITACLQDTVNGRHFRVTRWNLESSQETDCVDWDCPRSAGYYLTSAHVYFSPNGRWLVEHGGTKEGIPGRADSLVVWNTANGGRRLTMPHARTFCFVCGDRTLVTTDLPTDRPAPRLRLLDLESGRAHELLPSPPDETGIGRNEINIVVPDPGGTVLAVGVGEPRASPLARWPQFVDWLDRHGLDFRPNQADVILVDATDGRELTRLPHGPVLRNDSPTLAFSPDGRRLAVLGEDAIRIWDLPIRRSWGLILSLAAISPAGLALFLLAVRGLRRLRTPRPVLPRAV